MCSLLQPVSLPHALITHLHTHTPVTHALLCVMYACLCASDILLQAASGMGAEDAQMVVESMAQTGEQRGLPLTWVGSSVPVDTLVHSCGAVMCGVEV